MLVIKGLKHLTAIDWVRVESISFEQNFQPAPDSSNCKLEITSKSGSKITIFNPVDLKGENVGFEELLQAWVDDIQKFVIVENDIKW